MTHFWTSDVPFVQLANARVAPVALHVEFGEVPVAAVHLNREMCALRRRFGRVPLRE